VVCPIPCRIGVATTRQFPSVAIIDGHAPNGTPCMRFVSHEFPALHQAADAVTGGNSLYGVVCPTHYERGNLRRHKGTVVEPTPEEIILQRSPTQCHWTSHRLHVIATGLYQRTTPGSACSSTPRKSESPSSAPAA